MVHKRGEGSARPGSGKHCAEQAEEETATVWLARGAGVGVNRKGRRQEYLSEGRTRGESKVCRVCG